MEIIGIFFAIIGYFGVWINQIIKYKHGEYNPYFFKKSQEKSIDLYYIFTVVLITGLSMISDNFFKKIILVLYFLTHFWVCGTMDLLIYKKTRDKKIIYKVIVFNTIIICLISALVVFLRA